MTDALCFHSEERVRKGAEKLSKFLNAKQQGRLDGFFTAQPKTSPKKDKDDGKGKGKGTKRKVRASHLLFSLVMFQSPANTIF